MTKVFCNECKFYSPDPYPENSFCFSPSAFEKTYIKDTPIKKGYWHTRNFGFCYSLNENNDCKYFEVN